MKLKKFMPLTKMVDQPGGTLMVYGLVTAEQPDLDREVFDYTKSKPYYLAKVEAMKKATSVPGMEQSIMPMREMHTLNAIGKGVSIDFDDAAKTIHMGFEVVDPLAITKFKKGVLVGFSQGGDYIGPKLPDKQFPGCKRFIANPGEVSGVDSPCLPIALVDSMKTKEFAHVKLDGSTTMQKFHLPVTIDADTVEDGLIKVNGQAMSECVEDEAEFHLVHAGVTKYFKSRTAEFNVEQSFNELKELVEQSLTKGIVPGPGVNVTEHEQPAAQQPMNPTLSVFTCPDCGATQPKSDAMVNKCEKCGKEFGKARKEEDYAYHTKAVTLGTYDKAVTLNSLLKLQDVPEADRPIVRKKVYAALKAHGVDLMDFTEKVNATHDFARAFTATGDLQKCMADVTDMAQVLQTLKIITMSQAFDIVNELDSSTLPKDLYGLMESTVTILKDLVDEETREILAAAGGILGGKAMNQEQMKKSAGHIAKAKEMASSFQAHMAGVHKAHLDHVTALTKANTDGGNNEHLMAIHKAHHDHVTALHKAHVDAMHGCLNKAMAGYDAAGKEPNPSSITEVADHPGAPVTEDITAGAPHTNSKALTMDDLNKAIKEAREEGETKAMESFADMLKAGLSDDDDIVVQPAAGIGDRANKGTQPNKVQQTQPVTKAADATTDPPTTVDASRVTTDDVIAANNGDQDAMLKMARAIKVNPTGVPSSIQNTKLMGRA